MKLRLLVTKDCNKSCQKCCNKQFNLDTLPVCESYKGYDEIILTGGEPMLYPEMVLKLLQTIRDETGTPIYMYTAKVDGIESVAIYKQLDGITVTLHDQKDVLPFWYFLLALNTDNKSKQVNIFKGVDATHLFLWNWNVKNNIDWIEDCPLPQNEVFMRV